MSQKSIEENWTYEIYSEKVNYSFPYFYESNINNLTPSEKKELIAVLKGEL
jgi:hypothetical protein